MPFLRACHTRAKIRMNSKKVDFALLLCEYFEDACLCLKSPEGCQRQGDPGKHTVTPLFRSPSTVRTMSCSIVLCCYNTKKREENCKKWTIGWFQLIYQLKLITLVITEKDETFLRWSPPLKKTRQWLFFLLSYPSWKRNLKYPNICCPSTWS